MFSSTSSTLLFFVIGAVCSMPHLGNSLLRNPRSAGFNNGGYSSSVGSSSASSHAYSSSSANSYSTPGRGSSSLYAKADLGGLTPNYISDTSHYASRYGNQAQNFGSGVPTNDVGGVGANAYGQIGPQGGFGSANVYPPPQDGIDDRFGGGDSGTSPNRGPVGSVSGTFPPPKGTFHGISTFSSSGQSDVNGKKSSFKTSSVTVNDNGKVTTYTAHDP